MAIRISGLTSGLDTDAIVQELVSAYSLKTEKYEKAQTKLTWKQDTWKSLNTKIYSLYTSVSNLRFSSAYSLKKTSVSDNTKATVTASSDATTGTQKLNILQTAQSGYVTGGQLASGVTGDTKLSELGYTSGNSTIEVKKSDGTTEQIKITDSTTVKDFVSSLKNAGLNASLDENNRRIFVSAKESGLNGDFTLTGLDENGEAALKALGLDVALVSIDATTGKASFTGSAAAYKEAYERFYQKATDTDGDGVITTDDIKAYIYSQIEEYENQQKAWNIANGKYQLTSANNRTLQEKLENDKVELASLQEKYASTYATETEMDARIAELDAIVAPLQEAVSTASANLETAQTKVNDAQAKVDEVNAQIAALDTSSDTYAEDLAALEEQRTAAEEELATAQAELIAAEEAHTTANDALAEHEAEAIELEELTKLKELPTTISETEATIEANNTIIAEAEAAMAAAKKAQEACDVDEFIAMKNDKNNSEETNLATLDRAIYEMADKAVRANEILTDTTGAYTSGSGVKIDAADAIIELNGVQFTSSTNSFSINGLSITAQAVTGAGDENAIQITTSTDTQGIYDKIKDFLTEYNALINEMTKLYNAESAGDYEPLTDEEKEAMTDEQIEKWETKIKDSLLRRDTTLNSVMSAMINSMAQPIEINGKKVSLSTFGISTLSYFNVAENENYAYHIDGDEDDENTSGNEEKLMAAIEEDPEQVVEFMKQLTSTLYTAIDNKMKSTDLSSAYKVYNDKEMDKQQTEYEKLIAKWEEKIKDKEDYYYDKFTQMETALSKLQSSSSSLSGLLGTSS